VNPILDHLGLVTKGTRTSWAVTSPDDKYRYLLGRQWDADLPQWCVCGLNPSKARHDRDDHTIRKLIGFGKRHKAGGFIMVNLMAYSETDSRRLSELQTSVDLKGEHNTRAVTWARQQCDRHIAAWGRIPAGLEAVALWGNDAFAVFRLSECFGLNADRTPRHPLRLAYDTPLVARSVAEVAMNAGWPNGIAPT
jgi:hypothetical protein